jgi:hypothetical protein
MLWVRRPGCSHFALKVDGAFHRIDGTGELDQDAVAHDLDDPPAMLSDEGIEDVLTPLLQCGLGARFVLLHEAAVADHVGRQYGS